MKQTYSDEFYNHLYRLESYNKVGESWSRKADKNNPDLIWIRNYIKENNLFDEYSHDRLERMLNNCISRGLVTIKEIADDLELSVRKMHNLLVKYDLLRKQRLAYYAKVGYVITDKNNDNPVFVKSISHGLRVAPELSRRSFVNLEGHRVMRNGRHLYKTDVWKEQHPEFNLEEVA
ncbi:hypothetical protein [Limosilactobacillus reuteri]|uniref:Uncharacterized protein n=1 Tax=Limosilactobacillus reuteri TaxID=1598 RepID=A0AAW9U1I0_LIMRT|nr:hypothetical protein [Limosilactobacillus reuteri]MRG74576.1 hypothetical protein [Limosilactobacillus reuteri]OUL51968.1 hypothetical protein B2G46_09940 [Limosilactobacillus reuteri]